VASIVKVKGESVGVIIRKLDPIKKELAEKLRSLIKSTLPDAAATVKWGNITYTLNGKNLVWLLFYKDHLDFGFFTGAKLHSKLLEGTGKSLRHIKIRTSQDINEPEFTRLLKDAAKMVK
jgi:hypothetical protein